MSNAQPRELTIRPALRDDGWVDLREIVESFFEVVGLFLVAIITRDPSRFVDVYFASTHFYSVAQVPVAHAVRVTYTYTVTRFTTRV